MERSPALLFPHLRVLRKWFNQVFFFPAIAYSSFQSRWAQQSSHRDFSLLMSLLGRHLFLLHCFRWFSKYVIPQTNKKILLPAQGRVIIHAKLSWGGGILMWIQATRERSSLLSSSPLFDDRASPAPNSQVCCLLPGILLTRYNCI